MAKFLANENMPGEVVEAARQAGHDIAWIGELSPGMDDDTVLATALADGRVLLTFDKDFGEMAFRQGKSATCGIVLFRPRLRSPAYVTQFVVSVLGANSYVGRKLRRRSTRQAAGGTVAMSDTLLCGCYYQENRASAERAHSWHSSAWLLRNPHSGMKAQTMSGPKGRLRRSEREYVEQRAELLAQLVLTRRKDVEVISVGQAFDTGIDLSVRLHHPVMHGQVLPMFGVQVKGTSTPIPDEQTANAYVNAGHKHRQTKSLFLFPLVLFLFSVDGDLGYYSWLMKPDVAGENGPRLTTVASFDMVKIGKRSVDDMTAKVQEWFEAMCGILSHQEAAK